MFYFGYLINKVLKNNSIDSCTFVIISTQCETGDESVFDTEYFIANSNNIYLILVMEDVGEMFSDSQSSQFIAVATDLECFYPEIII